MDWTKLFKPIIGLSPMADFTDSPFCRLVRECACPPMAEGEAVIFREMLAAEAIVRGNKRTLGSLAFSQAERPLVQQLFGSDPEALAKAAQIVMQTSQPDGIDVNMGCPVYKAVSNFNGASLMREPNKAAAIVRAMKSTNSLPLSVKTRLGWSKQDEIVDFAQVLEQAGVDAIEIHARTKNQAYSGKADWAAVKKVVDKVKIPVLINGDIVDPLSAQEALSQSGAKGLLIGRGALGNPWIFKRIETVLSGQPDPGEPSLDERLKGLRRHAELQVEYYGEKGLVKLRKHFPWYFKGIPGFRQFRASAVRISTMEDLDRLLSDIRTGPQDLE
ncbi:MAG: tRNA dihydrouridine synthase DusB [Patescibacteria group bacterium]|nr:tRNA dihydrouridine synthase DusB [Patescibacteria group bacterium]